MITASSCSRIAEAIEVSCGRIARELDLSVDEVLSLAMVEFHSRLDGVKPRLLMSVGAESCAVYVSALEMHLAEADRSYAAVLGSLMDVPVRTG